MINNAGSRILLRNHNKLLNREIPYPVQEFATALLYSPCCRYHHWSIRRETHCLQGDSMGGNIEELSIGLEKENLSFTCHLIAYIFSISATYYTNRLSWIRKTLLTSALNLIIFLYGT
jgi:hypothetical protein